MAISSDRKIIYTCCKGMIMQSNLDLLPKGSQKFWAAQPRAAENMVGGELKSLALSHNGKWLYMMTQVGFIRKFTTDQKATEEKQRLVGEFNFGKTKYPTKFGKPEEKALADLTSNLVISSDDETLFVSIFGFVLQFDTSGKGLKLTHRYPGLANDGQHDWQRWQTIVLHKDQKHLFIGGGDLFQKIDTLQKIVVETICPVKDHHKGIRKLVISECGAFLFIGYYGGRFMQYSCETCELVYDYERIYSSFWTMATVSFGECIVVLCQDES
jgi:hypothetical protein